MIEWKQMTMQEAENKMEVFREIFDVVRLLKGSDLQAAGMESKLAGRENLCQCYAFWNKDKRCENCISLKALEEKKQTSKIEFLDSDMYQVFARYLEIDSEPYVMEMLKKLDENTLTDEEGYEKLTEKLTVEHKDSRTGFVSRSRAGIPLVCQPIEDSVGVEQVLLPEEVALYNALVIYEEIRIRELRCVADIPPDLVASLAEGSEAVAEVHSVVLVAAGIVEGFHFILFVAISVHCVGV